VTPPSRPEEDDVPRDVPRDTHEEELPAVVAANVKRWSADDDGWRGYHRSSGELVLDDRVTRALGLADPRPGCDYADVGCANGVLTGVFAKHLGAKTVMGIDYVDMGVPEPIRFCRANLDTREPLPLDTGSCDVVTCMETLEHVHDTDHLARELRRVLRPDGYAVISVPRLDALLNIMMLATGFQPPAIECSLAMRYGAPDPTPRVSGHVAHFTRRALLALLEANGFTVDGFAQAGIYGAWRSAQARTPPLWQRAPLWLASRVPVKQDVLIVRARPAQA
jgi:SAM-dependent methyltransferase